MKTVVRIVLVVAILIAVYILIRLITPQGGPATPPAPGPVVDCVGTDIVNGEPIYYDVVPGSNKTYNLSAGSNLAVVETCGTDGKILPYRVISIAGTTPQPGTETPAPVPAPGTETPPAPTPVVDTSKCGATVVSVGEPFHWVTDMTIGGDTSFATGVLLNDGDKQLAVIAKAGKSGDVMASNMSGRLWQLKGSNTQLACYMDAQIASNPKFVRWFISDTDVPAGWTNTPPSDWETSTANEATIDGLVDVKGATWDANPTPVDPSHLVIGDSTKWIRCELWKPTKPGWTWDTLIKAGKQLSLEKTWQGQCWGITGISSDNKAQLFQLSEQRSWQHQQRMQAGSAFNGMFLEYVGDKADMPAKLFVTTLTVQTNSWVNASETTPTGWTIK